ncbi:MAG: hypothetical protein KBG28_31780 [Kofleriaceae bacterium]|jgi:hypothetical protein|nr:hypothetical protein [Kofleriaceae bacterium]MBP6836799.1 hypothetical protein [Kofleriaceae bacterium]MBP9208591.1 hypothetical protein [Kofleriaceae bacterium]
MSFEYAIRFAVAPEVTASGLAKRLAAAAPDPVGAASYDYYVVADGIVFVDHVKSDAASVALRRLIDEALRHADQVTIEEL